MIPGFECSCCEGTKGIDRIIEAYGSSWVWYLGCRVQGSMITRVYGTGMYGTGVVFVTVIKGYLLARWACEEVP